MHELGNVQNAAHGTRALKPPWNEMPDPTKETVTIRIADDDAAAAVIRNPLHTQDVQQDSQNTDARSSASRPTKTETLTKAIMATPESSRQIVYSDPSELVAWLRDEIKAINSFDGFMLGVYEKIEKFTTQVEFSLEQILDIEQNMAKRNSTLEIGKFSLVRIRMERVKALRSQGNLEPERVLHLLEDVVASPSTAQQVLTRIAAPPE
jgi:hypothetical protein